MSVVESVVKEKKPRGRNTKKTGIVEESTPNVTPNISVTIETEETDIKKRGRKPRSSKIVTKQKAQSATSTNPISNVILHLKCSLTDLNEYNNKLQKLMTNPLEYNPEIPPEVTTYDMSKTQSFASFEDVEKWPNPVSPTNDVLNHPVQKICPTCACGNVQQQQYPAEEENVEEDDSENVNMRDIHSKLKLLKVQLYKNSLQQEKKSACFWCTYDYDNTTCYIPKYEMDGVIYGYGSFCRPECAVAYLMKENLDDSTKFERYHLLNQIYSQVYNLSLIHI